MDIKTIRKAVELNHGGPCRDDEQIKIIWDSLPDEAKEKYLTSLKGEPKDASITKPKCST